MDTVRFRLGPHVIDGRHRISIQVNDFPLAEFAAKAEKPFRAAEGRGAITSDYSGLTLVQLDGAPLDHFLGSEGSDLACGSEDKTVLLICECGEPGCWPLMAQVTATSESVKWRDFEQPHRRAWSYDGLRFEFDRGQYETALASLDSPPPEY